MMKQTVIRGSGRYVPPRLVTNDDLSQWMDTSDEWIRQRTGQSAHQSVFPEIHEITGRQGVQQHTKFVIFGRAEWYL